MSAVLQNSRASEGLQRGFNRLASLLALTLGPTQGTVLSQRDGGAGPEVLADAATIARRLLAFPDRAEDVGAMLLRNLVWRTQQRAGDGGATAAVLAQAILNEVQRYRAAGTNMMALRHGIEHAATTAVATLRAMARPVRDEEDLSGVAYTMTVEPELSVILGELFDLLGPDAHITIEEYLAPYLERTYSEGGRWRGRLVSPYLLSDPVASRAVLSGCHVVLVRGSLTTLRDIRPILELIARQSRRHLLLVADEVKGEALNALVTNHQRKTVQAIGVELRRAGAQRLADFEDLAALTGARLIAPDVGRSLQRISTADLGKLRRAEATADELTVVGERRPTAGVRQHLTTLRARLEALPDGDVARDELRSRLARLAGNVATLKIGANSKAERETLRRKAEQGLRALPLAIREGIVPGGGVAYLNCIEAVRAADVTGEARWGVEILARALEAPFRRIVDNAGVAAPGVVLAEARRRGAGAGYDALQGQIVMMEQAGLVDAAGVLRCALEAAVSGALMALTTETIVLKRRPETSMEP